MPATSILIVEDVVQLAQIVQELLETEGYTVHCVHSYEEGLIALKAVAFELLITDAHLGSHSGIELIRIVKHFRPDLRAILTSGFPISSAQKSDPSFRCTHFLNKPFTPAELYACVRELLATDCA
ncbi:MAG TPA: response regulator [Terriglobales bacterium]|jgi:CheY-like chemotaxis protein|nr:response regulator [Terriglobales bacterium]